MIPITKKEKTTPFLPAISLPLPRSAIESVPTTITSKILTYLGPKDIAAVQQVSTKFQYLWGNDGSLNLSNSNITNDNLPLIIGKYKKCSKLVSLNLSGTRITDTGLALFAKAPLT